MTKRKFPFIKIKTAFGNTFDFPIPPGYDTVVLCINTGTGLQPVKVCMPSQIYEKDLLDLIESYKFDLHLWITLIPFKSREIIDIYKK